MTTNWSKINATGVPVIDSTNECLQFVLSELFLGARPCPGETTACPKIEDVERFLKRKFDREEILMANTGFPRLAAHEAEHARLLRRLRAMRERVVCGGYDPETMHDLLTEWIVDHVSLFDAEFGRYLTSRPNSDQSKTLPTSALEDI